MKLYELMAENKIKYLGRYDIRDEKLSAFWGGNGFDANLYCDIDSRFAISIITNDRLYFAIYLDSRFICRSELIDADRQKIEFTVPKGKHSLRIVRDTQINKFSDKYCFFDEIEFDGEFLKKPEDKPMFIEIIGDSIACGDGALGKYKEGESWNDPYDHSITNGFAYKLCEKLGGDYDIIARGGIGFLDNTLGSQEESKPAKRICIQEIYPLTNGYYDLPENKNLRKISRIPDLIIIELGGNDSIKFEDIWKKLFAEFSNSLRADYGNKDIPIVWSGRNTTHCESIISLASEGSVSNLHPCFYHYGGSGSAALKTQKSGHPSADEQTEICDNLFRFLKENIL